MNKFNPHKDPSEIIQNHWSKIGIQIVNTIDIKIEVHVWHKIRIAR